MIPRKIHYCWLSDEAVPESLQKCIDSWKKYLPDYELILWNFNRFPRGRSRWVDEAFDNKKYAFAADYIRLYALYNYGGVYLDMDVEVLKSFTPLLNLRTFVCWQNEMRGLEVAAMGAEKGCRWLKLCLDRYENRPFVRANGSFDTKVLPCVVEDILRKSAYELPCVDNIDAAKEVEATKDDVPVFSCDFFSPKSYKTGNIMKTKNTFCVHHFAGSWIVRPRYETMETRFWKIFGLKNLNILGKIYWKLCFPVIRKFQKEDD